MTVLDEINLGVRQDMDDRIKKISRTRIQELAADAPLALDAYQALEGGRLDPLGTRIIAEVKRKSPSKGDLASIADPALLAQSYEAGGASVISCLTEQRRFNGSLADFDQVREAVKIPVLRKDFTVDEYMIYEARAHGADLVLLIVASLDDQQLRDYLDLTHELGMNALVETHTAEEIERAVAADSKILGVNVRNLKTLDVDVNHYATLAAQLPENVIRIAESGVQGIAEIEEYTRQGADAILVGEALVKHGSPKQAVQDFRAAAASVQSKN